ncbi:uncharacterized protein LOC129593785 [Paramacrobiotus metropolitanus]|uniref:uncharacterized protein LOC129593785 n=1 Tax=Paramacrobiotus metropolitanus TaxID=2943436 RepID=UPI002445A591|nr:uncharacterized protein LOC129593785 [Paramacrobiotus metropolitanus]
MECPGINITARSAWGAPDLSVSIPYLIHPVAYMVYTHTKGEACTDFDMCRTVVAAIREFHTDPNSWTAQMAANFTPEIFYNFLIGMDGSVFEGRGWNRRAEYHKDYNEQGIVTAFIENIPISNDGYKALTYAAAKTANALLVCARSNGYLNPMKDSVIVNIHQQAKDYILHPETLKPRNDTDAPFVAEKPNFSEGVVAGIVFGIILLVVLALALLALLWQHTNSTWKQADNVGSDSRSHRNRNWPDIIWTELTRLFHVPAIAKNEVVLGFAESSRCENSNDVMLNSLTKRGQSDVGHVEEAHHSPPHQPATAP